MAPRRRWRVNREGSGFERRYPWWQVALLSVGLMGALVTVTLAVIGLLAVLDGY